jgi:tetratricopeptide (TPR) repeat protein
MQAEQSLAQAQALAPDAVETLTAWGYYHYWGHLDFPAADAAFDSALERSPNHVKAIVGKAYAARRDGRFEEALTLLLVGRRLDPMNIETHSSVVETLIGLGRFDEALAALDRAREPGQAMAIDPTISSWLWESLGDAERAWQAVADAGDNTRVRFYQSRSYCAQRTRDPERILLALETWPKELRRPAAAPEAYELQRARSLMVLGETDQAHEVLLAVKARIDATDEPYSEGWNSNALYFPVDLPGLLGDTAGVRAAIADWKANHRRDVWDEQAFRGFFAEAFANAGDADAALDQIDLLVAMAGPWVYPALSINPALDSLHEHPRYMALKARYEALR